MGEEINNAENSAEKQQRVIGRPFKKGQSGNPKGRPKGTENFSTKFRRFIEKIAENNKITPEEVEEQLLAIGYKEAKAGNYSFWRDLHDRVYGKPIQPMEHKGDVEIIRNVNITIIDGSQSQCEQDIQEECAE
jgi:hypothetical protein